jgi:hypothetical protein
MNVEDFFARAKELGVEVSFDYDTKPPYNGLANEAMFHLPLIAMTILMLAKGQAKPRVDEIGQLVGDCFERTFAGFRGSAQHLGWSGSLRVRTVQALAFLEVAALLEVNQHDKRISSTDLGRKVIDRALSIGGDLAANLFVAERGYRNIRAERQLQLNPT